MLHSVSVPTIGIAKCSHIWLNTTNSVILAAMYKQKSIAYLSISISKTKVSHIILHLILTIIKQIILEFLHNLNFQIEKTLDF